MLTKETTHFNAIINTTEALCITKWINESMNESMMDGDNKPELSLLKSGWL